MTHISFVIHLAPGWCSNPGCTCVSILIQFRVHRDLRVRNSTLKTANRQVHDCVGFSAVNAALPCFKTYYVSSKSSLFFWFLCSKGVWVRFGAQMKIRNHCSLEGVAAGLAYRQRFTEIAWKACENDLPAALVSNPLTLSCSLSELHALFYSFLCQGLF